MSALMMVIILKIPFLQAKARGQRHADLAVKAFQEPEQYIVN